jgi:hypothetical protein
LGLGLILYSIFFYTRQTRFPGLAAIPPCLGAALIIFSGTVRPTFVSRMLTFKPVVFIGLISYSLYLWHWPVLVFSKYASSEAQSWEIRVALLVASFLLAIGSWKFIETPFRKRRLCPHRPQVFALAGCSAFLLLILGVLVFLQHGVPSRLPAKALVYYNSRNNFAYYTDPNDVTPSGLTPGQMYAFRVRVHGSKNQLSDWSDVVSHMAI